MCVSLNGERVTVGDWQQFSCRTAAMFCVFAMSLRCSNIELSPPLVHHLPQLLGFCRTPVVLAVRWEWATLLCYLPWSSVLVDVAGPLRYGSPSLHFLPRELGSSGPGGSVVVLWVLWRITA